MRSKCCVCNMWKKARKREKCIFADRMANGNSLSGVVDKKKQYFGEVWHDVRGLFSCTKIYIYREYFILATDPGFLYVFSKSCPI